MEQFDIKEFAQMFDAALASDNPTVKKALRNFMMVAAIVHAQELNEDERLMGPLEALLKKVSELESLVHNLNQTRTYKDNYRDYYRDHISTSPAWVYSPNTNISSISSTTGTNTAYSTTELTDLMKDLKFK